MKTTCLFRFRTGIICGVAPGRSSGVTGTHARRNHRAPARDRGPQTRYASSSRAEVLVQRVRDPGARATALAPTASTGSPPLLPPRTQERAPAALGSTSPHAVQASQDNSFPNSHRMHPQTPANSAGDSLLDEHARAAAFTGSQFPAQRPLPQDVPAWQGPVPGTGLAGASAGSAPAPGLAPSHGVDAGCGAPQHRSQTPDSDVARPSVTGTDLHVSSEPGVAAGAVAGEEEEDWAGEQEVAGRLRGELLSRNLLLAGREPSERTLIAVQLPGAPTGQVWSTVRSQAKKAVLAVAQLAISVNLVAFASLRQCFEGLERSGITTCDVANAWTDSLPEIADVDDMNMAAAVWPAISQGASEVIIALTRSGTTVDATTHSIACAKGVCINVVTFDCDVHGSVADLVKATGGTLRAVSRAECGAA